MTKVQQRLCYVGALFCSAAMPVICFLVVLLNSGYSSPDFHEWVDESFGEAVGAVVFGAVIGYLFLEHHFKSGGRPHW